MENPVISSIGKPGEEKQQDLQWDERAGHRAFIGGSRVKATGGLQLPRSQNTRPSRSDGPQLEANSFTSTGRQGRIGGIATVSSKVLRQIIGLNPFKTSYFSLFRPLKGNLKMQVTMLLGVVCAIAAGIPLPIVGVIFARLIDEFPPSPDALETRVSQLLGTACAYFAVTWVWSICWAMVGERVSRGLREALVEKVLGMDMEYYDTDAPDISAALTGDTQIIQMGTSEKVGLFIQAISYFVAAFTVGFILNAALTGVLFAAVIPTMVIMVVTGTTLVSKYQKKGAEITEEASSLATGAIDGVRVVQAFGAADALLAKHSKILARASAANTRKTIVGGVMLGMVFFIAFAANALAFYRGARLVDGSAGTVYAVVFLILDASFVVGQFGPFLQTFALAASAGGKIFGILDREPSSIDVYSDEGIKSENCFENDIQLEDVSFVYPARTTDRVLDQVSLHFKAHTHTGVVGKSGSGKSTIAALLMRFYDPQAGSVMIGENNIQDFHLPTLRSQIALVDQEPTLFTGTILENIRHGIPEADKLSDEEVRERCAQAAVDANATFISDLPKGIHTKVSGSGGAALSGGQRQRICLARALVRKPKLLILDEPTSSLDSTSEALVLEAVRKIPRTGCTVITIAHRLATIKAADKIIVMDQGTMLEQGSHQELIEKDGAYKAFVDAQQMESSIDYGEIQSYAKEKSASDEDVAALNKAEEVDEEDEREIPTKELPITSVLRRIMSYVKPERPLIILGICASTVSGAVIVGEAIVFGNLITLVESSSRTTSYGEVDFYCLMFFVVSVVALVSYSSSSSLFGLASEKLMLRIRSRSLSTILRQDIAWFSQPGHSSSELLSTMQMDVSNLSGLSGVLIGTSFTVVTCVTAGIILAHIIAWRIAIVILASVPVMIFAAFIRLRVLGKAEKRHETAYNDASALATEAVRAIRVVAAFGRENDVMREYQKAIQKPYEQAFRFAVLGNSMLAFSLAIPFFIYSLAYWWGSTNVREGRYSPKDFFIVLPALLYSAQMAGQLFSLAPELTRAKSASRNVFDLHDAKPTIMKEYDPSSDQEWEKDKTLSASSSEKTSLAKGAAVSLDQVNFSYPSRQDVSVLKDVSLSIKPGKFIGVVGRSGAGKSSLISLLERFYDPMSGSVRVDQKDIKTVPDEDHRARLALVAQDPDLFPGSITFNIGLGASPGHTVSQETIEDVCKKVGLHDFIMSLSEGYNTECGRNGSQLSGGQKQRVAIARALIRDPDVLILDEATSSLDSKSEREVQEATNAATSDRTTIVVAHRLSTVQKADKIFVFEKGELVEQGTHDELVALGGIYTGMVRTQELGG